MPDKFKDYMGNADPKKKMQIIEQAMGAVEMKIQNLNAIARNPDVPNSQKQGIKEDITEAEERLEVLRKELEKLKEEPPNADQP